MELAAPQDAELVARTLAGDHEAFGQLYDRYARLVRAVALGVSGDWTAIDDLVQECFLRAFRKLTALRDREQFGPWIVGIARHVARDHRRSRRRDRHEFGEVRMLTRSSADGVANADNADQLDVVMQQLNRLPEKERLAIHLFFLEEQSVQYGAEVLNLSRSGFYALVQRVVARLAAQLRPLPSEEAMTR